MNNAIGIDIVQVNRFNSWVNWPDKKLSRVFSMSEIAYAKKNPLFTAQRFAVRFAAKEAFFKALHQLLPHKTISLLTILPAVSVAKEKSGRPYLSVQYEQLGIGPLNINLSLSHSVCCTVAIVQLLYLKNK